MEVFRLPSRFAHAPSEISDYGAHNQRGTITLTIRPQRKNGLWNGSDRRTHRHRREIHFALVYPLVKRPDEQCHHAGLHNPVFVEDVVRNAARLLKKEKESRGLKSERSIKKAYP